MMTNLFSTFDPCTGMLSLNWLSMMIMFFIMPYKMWMLPNKKFMLFKKLSTIMDKEIKMLTTYKGASMMLYSMMMMIMIINMMGLLPYIFTASSHLILPMTLALPMWMSLMLYGWINKTNKMFSHLLPTGTPVMLMPFMVLIETTSNIIRPGSLAVRLTANMIAGHLLMSLLGNNTQNSINLMINMLVFIILMTFESAVAIIQAYVFMTLSTLYSSEI